MSYAPTNLLDVIIVVFVVVVIAKFLAYVNTPRKSSRYRTLLTDLYVSGRIRQLAKTDGIDLDEEKRLYLQTDKESRRYDQDLDDSIEDDLKDKIIQKEDKKETK